MTAAGRRRAAWIPAQFGASTEPAMETTMRKLLKGIATLAASNVDKESASQLAATVAESLARRSGHPGLHKVTELVAQGLKASAQRPNQTPPQRSPAATDGWQHALHLLQAARSQGPGPAGGSPAPTSGAPTATPSGKGRTVSRGTLSGRYDAANIGPFAFTFYNGTQLQVNQLRASSNVGGQFWLADMPAGTWHRLKDRGERLLPVWIRVHGIDVEAQVGDGPSGAPILQATDMLNTRG